MVKFEALVKLKVKLLVTDTAGGACGATQEAQRHFEQQLC